MLTINNTIDGAIQDIEIKGNTVQDPNNLADIKSVGELQEDGTYKMSILSCGKNLFDKSMLSDYISGTDSDGSIINYDKTLNQKLTNLKFKEGKQYTFSVKCKETIGSKNPRFIFVYTDGTTSNISHPVTTSMKTYSATSTAGKTIDYISVSYSAYGGNWVVDLSSIQLEEGTVATDYEPYQENKCDILLPCQLEKVGDMSDRLYYDDVEKAWCIEKKIGNVVLNG